MSAYPDDDEHNGDTETAIVHHYYSATMATPDGWPVEGRRYMAPSPRPDGVAWVDVVAVYRDEVSCVDDIGRTVFAHPMDWPHMGLVLVGPTPATEEP